MRRDPSEATSHTPSPIPPARRSRRGDDRGARPRRRASPPCRTRHPSGTPRQPRRTGAQNPQFGPPSTVQDTAIPQRHNGGMCALALGHPSTLCYDRGSGTAVVWRRGGPMGRGRRGWAGRGRGGPQRPGEPPGRQQISSVLAFVLRATTRWLAGAGGVRHQLSGDFAFPDPGAARRRSTRSRPSGQFGPLECLPGGATWHRGGVDQPHLVLPGRHLAGQVADDRGQQRRGGLEPSW